MPVVSECYKNDQEGAAGNQLTGGGRGECVLRVTVNLSSFRTRSRSNPMFHCFMYCTVIEA
jgi:hypothetical protein